MDTHHKLIAEYLNRHEQIDYQVTLLAGSMFGKSEFVFRVTFWHGTERLEDATQEFTLDTARVPLHDAESLNEWLRDLLTAAVEHL